MSTLRCFATGMTLVFSMLPAFHSDAYGQFRGLPKHIQIESLLVEESFEATYASVCYQFTSTVPYLDYAKVVYSQSRPFFSSENDLKYLDFGGQLTNDPKDGGVELRFKVYNFLNLYAYLDSDHNSVSPERVEFINSLIRLDAVNQAKAIVKYYESADYARVRPFEYENVRFCERIPFPAAYDKAFVEGLFHRRGLLGYYNLSGRFIVNVFLPSFIGGNSISQALNQADFVIPIFGLRPMEARDFSTAEFFHYSNSVSLLRNNIDIDEINRLINEYSDIRDGLKDTFDIEFSDQLTTEDLVRIATEIYENSER